MAGKNRANTLSAILSNMEDLTGAYETALNAEGSALKENENQLDSIQGKITLFTNSVQTMWMNFIDSEVVKFVVDLGTKLIKLVDTIGIIPSALAGVLVYFTAFKKNNPVTIFKDISAQMYNYGKAMEQIKSIQSLNGVGQIGAESLNAQHINAYAAAVQNLTAKQQAATLASAGLTKSQIEEAMAKNGVRSENIQLAMSEASVATEKNKSIAVTGLQAAAIAKSGAAKLSEASANWLAALGEEQLTLEKVQSAVASKVLTAEQGAEIITTFGLVGANNAASLSFKGLTASIKAMMASNPIGWILMIIGAVISLVSLLVSLRETTEELSQAAEEAINKYTQSTNSLRDQKKAIDELSGAYEKLSKSVDLNTNENISLTTDAYEEYLDVCNDIADMYPHLVTGFDEQGNAILSLRGNVEALTQAYNDAAQAARQELISRGGKVFDSFKSDYDNQFIDIFTKDELGLKQQLDIAKKIQDLIAAGDENLLLDELNDMLSMESGNNLPLQVTLEAAGIDIDDIRNQWTQEIYSDNLGQASLKLGSFIKSTTTKLNTETQKVKSLMDAYLGEDLDYAALSKKSKSYIDQIVSGLEAEFISSFDSADALYNWVKENIVSAFQDPSVVDAINELSDIQLKVADGDISYADYTKLINQEIAKIQNKVDDNVLAQIKIGIGIDEGSLQTSVNHIQTLLGNDPMGPMTKDLQDKIHSLSVEDLQVAGQLEVPEGTILSWDELVDKIKEVKIAATEDFDITNYTDAISNHSAVISEYQEALQKLGKGSFTMDDFMELIKKYPKLAKGVDISSNAFHGLSRNLSGAVRTSTKNFVKDLQKLRAELVAAGKSTGTIDQLIDSIENMPDDALVDIIEQYSTLADEINRAKLAQDQLMSSMEENPNEGYETRGEAMEYMKEAMEKGEIGSESNLWNVAEKYGFTYDSAKTINENADALAKFIAIREKWFKQDDDGDDRTDDGYSYKGTESFIEAVESASQSEKFQEELKKNLGKDSLDGSEFKWLYDENTGTLDFDFDNENWDAIVTALSKTEQLAGLTSDEFADMMIQVGQYFGIDWGNYDDVLDHLNSVATGTSDAKTKVEEYGKAMQDYFGSDTTIDLTVRPMVKFDSTNFADWEKHYQEIINNPDGHSEADVKNAQEQLEAIKAGDSYATVYSSTFSNEDGTKSIVVTPILPDGTVLSPEELESYAEKLLAGEEIDPDINIKLAEFDGSNSIQKAGEYAQALHEVQAAYDTLRDTLKINTTIDEKGLNGLAEIKEIQDTINTKSDGTVVIDEEAFREALTGAKYTEDQIDLIIDKIKTLNKDAFKIDPFKIDETLIDQGVAGLEEIEKIRGSLTKDASTGLTVFDTDKFTAVLKESEYTEDQIDSLIKKIQEYDNIVSVSGSTDPLGLNSASLSIDSLKASLSTLGIKFEDTLGTWFDGKRDLTINVTDLVTTLKAKGWTDASIKEYITQLSNNTNLEGFNVKVKGIENIDEVIKKANNVPEEETTKYTVTGTGLSTVKTINDELSKIPATKSTQYTITETTVKETKTKDDTEDDSGVKWYNPFTWFADGTAHASGTAYSGGSWGATRTETALTGELGPEILVRNGRWTTVGENGAEFTQVKKGDIIFNHKQSEQLLKNGYVTGRGKAYAGGTAYIEGGGIYSKYDFSGSGGYEKYDVNNNVVDSWGDLSGALDDAAGSASDAADEFREVFDWIEVRLEEINEIIDLKSAELENKIGYADKNEVVDEIIVLNQKLCDNLLAGANRYYSYAKHLLSKVPQAYRDEAQDGSIAITEFVGEVDEKTFEAIQEYREWVQKGADLTQQAEETITEIRSLAKQAFDNISEDFDNEVSLHESKISQLESHNDLLETDKGFSAEDIYQAIRSENNAIIGLRKQQVKELQAELNSGKIEKYSSDWYDAVNALAEYDAEIIDLQVENENLQDSINELHWDKFDLLIKQYEAVSEEAENLMSILDTKDQVDEFGNWTNDGITSLGLLAQQMEAAEIQAKAYQDEIEYLNKNYKALGYTQEEYIDKLNELKSGQYDAINSYNDAKDAIVDLNKARVDAIKDGIQKEIDAYSELIEKKKQELDAEKDLYDFQKSTADQQKNISDIQRKLAALSGNTSASAVAKRKQLEAELAEAKADLEESYYERSVDNRQNALDKELKDFEDTKEEEIKGWEKYLENIEAVIADSLAMVQENTAAVLSTLQGMQEQYGLAITKTLLDPWKAGEMAIQTYGTKLNISLTQLASMLGLTVDELAAKLGTTTAGLVSNLDITVAQLADSLGLTNAQMAEKLGLTTSTLSGMMNLTIQDFATQIGITLPELAQKLGVTTAGLAGNLDITISQFASKMGLSVSELAGKFGLTAEDLANKLGMTYQDLTSPFGLAMSATVDALKALAVEYNNILASIKGDSQIAVDEVNKSMEKYQTPSKTQTQSQTQSTKPTNTTPAKKTVSIGGKVNAGSAKIYAYAGSNQGLTQYFANDPNYIVLDEKNGYVLVRHHKLSSGYTGWFKKSDVKAYAKGSKGVDRDQLALIDELGEELQFVPGANGRLEFVKKGTGIVPADLTERLMDLAMNPQDVLDRSRPQIAPSKSVINNNMEISVDASVGTLIHVDRLDGNNPDEVIKIVDKAWEKKMQGLNNAIKKFAR